MKDVLDALLRGVANENAQSHAAVAEHPLIQTVTAAVQSEDVDGFYFGLIFPLSEMIDGLLTKELPQSHEARFLFKHARFVETQFQKLFEKYEGSACCADKSRTVLRHLLVFFKTAVPVSFDYTQQYTYHLPKRVFITHEEIVSFFDAIYRLYYGNIDPFLTHIADLKLRMLDSPSS